jgi:hypothetical protein
MRATARAPATRIGNVDISITYATIKEKRRSWLESAHGGKLHAVTDSREKHTIRLVCVSTRFHALQQSTIP